MHCTQYRRDSWDKIIFKGDVNCNWIAQEDELISLQTKVSRGN